MSWESFDWKPADGASLGAGASILPLWPMLRSAIAEGISADALCPVTIGDLCQYATNRATMRTSSAIALNLAQTMGLLPLVSSSPRAASSSSASDS